MDVFQTLLPSSIFLSFLCFYFPLRQDFFDISNRRNDLRGAKGDINHSAWKRPIDSMMKWGETFCGLNLPHADVKKTKNLRIPKGI